MGSAVPPASSISRAAVKIVPGSFGLGSAVFEIKATLAPSAATRLAMARPMPRLPPDMNMVLPARSDMCAPSLSSTPGYCPVPGQQSWRISSRSSSPSASNGARIVPGSRPSISAAA